MERQIIHLRIDALPIAVERLKNPALKGKPVAICSRHSPRALIYAASEEARAEGVWARQPLTLALKHCKRLVILPPDEELYDRATRAVSGILDRYSPLVEPDHWGRFYLDLSGGSRLFGGAENLAVRLRKEVADSLRLSSTLGIGSNKLVSHVAAKVVRTFGDLYKVPPGSEASFLAPFQVRMLPVVKYKTEQALLAEFNIHTVSQLAGISVSQLVQVFGKFGILLHRQASGIDPQPVLPPSTKAFVLEETTLDEDTNDDGILLGILYRLMERACRRMRVKQMLPRLVWLHLRYADGMDSTRKLRLSVASLVDPVLFSILSPLFMQTDYRRQRIRYISLTFTNLLPAPDQLSLFEVAEDHPRETNLVNALDSIRGKFGEHAIGFGKTECSLIIKNH